MTIANLNTKNQHAWLETEALKFGTQNQLERYIAGLLPEAELVALARGELFSAFVAFKRWNNLSEQAADDAIRHLDTCATPFHPEILFGVVDAVMPPLTHDQWETVKLLRALAERINHTHGWCVPHVDVSMRPCQLLVMPRVHVATCKRCGEGVENVTALVSVTWAGRLLTREYAL